MFPLPDAACVSKWWLSGIGVRSFLALAYAAMVLLASGMARGAADYERDIKPLLRGRCYACHGALKQKAGLRLDTVALMKKGGESGEAVVAGDPAKSIIIERVTESDADERMPPKHEGEPFTPAQVQMLREWIASGAPAPVDEKAEMDPKEHWAFRPRVRPVVPSVTGAAWMRNPLDAFVARKREEHALAPQPEAPRIVLLRRLYFDLLGLPPGVEEIEDFEKEQSPDAYEKLVDRLLNNPRHGERWARHWMDIWRYSDWWGLGNELRNSQKHIWHWRDWMVESLNVDTPYDEMVRQMLAADELYPADPAKLRATGYLARDFFLFNRNQWMEETVEHVGKGFLGLTMNCAKCHDHKYDPIAQADYYRMRAFFEPYHVRMDMVPGESDLTRDGIPRAFDGWLDAPTYRFVRGEESKPDKTKVIAPGVPALLAFKELEIQTVSLPSEAWQPERIPWVLDAHIAAAKAKLAPAEAALTKSNEKLAEAGKKEQDAAGIQAVAVAEAEVKVATVTLDVARAVATSVEQRAAAMRATWANAGDSGDTAAVAAKAEREVTAATARQKVAEAELHLLRAAADKRSALEQEVKKAAETLEKAEKALAEKAQKYSPLLPAGAQWSPTRFLDSTKNDPVVKFPAQSSGRRKALAEWITDARNPLTARVAANHIWTRHMGTPLVANVFDFGRKSIAPDNPELLDWLASELVESGWSMKHLHRLIVTSATYRMSSSLAGGEASTDKDPENRFWWRRTPIRLESQAIRDSLLTLSGSLDSTMGGPPILPANQATSKRRSLYFFHSNNERNLFLSTFDDAEVKECYRRDQSIVPQQALALTNSKLVSESAPKIAALLALPDETAFVRKAFAVLLGIKASDAEVTASVSALDAWRKLPKATPENARGNFIIALINHNDFVTLR
jgi:hypothetical protein